MRPPLLFVIKDLFILMTTSLFDLLAESLRKIHIHLQIMWYISFTHATVASEIVHNSFL